MKRCSKCHELKDESLFCKHRKEPDGLYSQCKTCTKEVNKKRYWSDPEASKKTAKAWKESHREIVQAKGREYYAQNKHKERNWRLKKTYGITLDDYDNMLKSQNGVCAVCGSSSDKSFHVDHNHKTGKVRGLLCDKCNKALGFVKDDVGILEKLKGYLYGHS